MLSITTEQRDSAPINKRVYVPGTKLHDECPGCRAPWVLDLAEDYVSQYPKSGESLNVDAYCHNCEHEWIAGHVAYVLAVKIIAEPEPG